jgi:type II secretory pathway component PulJ
MTELLHYWADDMQVIFGNSCSVVGYSANATTQTAVRRINQVIAREIVLVQYITIVFKSLSQFITRHMSNTSCSQMQEVFCFLVHEYST